MRRNAAAHAGVIGLGMAAFVETNQHKNEKKRPSKEQRSHEPVREFQDVIDLIAVLGGVRRLAEKFINEREAIHQTCPNLLR